LNLRSTLSDIQKRALLRALQTVALADGGASDLEREFVEALDGSFTHVGAPLDVAPTIAPEELARVFPDPASRSTVLDLCILLALVNGTPSGDQNDRLSAIERAFGPSAELEVYRSIRAGDATHVRKVLDSEGFGGLLKRSYRRRHPLAWRIQRAKERLGLGRDDLIQKYRRYERFAPDTLGREYFEFIVRNELGFPGESGSLAEHLVYHDLAHVLGGFETTPEEEILVVAFQAATQTHNPFYSILTAICLFHLGMATSGARVVQLQTMKWKPGPFFEELRRGLSCRVDFSEAWDYRPYVRLPLREARRRLGILPRASSSKQDDS
jgi:hypothetical protein